MPRKPRRPRADSITAAVQAMTNAALPTIDPPAHCKLRPADLPFWEGIVRARARDQWTEADLVVAAQLARCQADIEREQVTLDGESTVVTNDRGTDVVNARVSVLEQFARREMALMRTLRLGGTSSGKTTRDERGLLQIEKQARRVRGDLASEPEEESLLAT